MACLDDEEGTRAMRRVHQVISLIFLLLAIYVAAESLRLGYFLPLGPGPGFFPFWLAALLGVLTLTWFVRVTTGRAAPPEELELPFVPRGAARWRVLSVIVATALLPAIGEHLGFRLTMLVCLLFLLAVTGRQRLPVAVVVGLAGSFGVYYVFHDLLDVYLPTARIVFLQDLGL